jgi:hypothetical protein
MYIHSSLAYSFNRLLALQAFASQKLNTTSHTSYQTSHSGPHRPCHPTPKSTFTVTKYLLFPSSLPRISMPGPSPCKTISKASTCGNVLTRRSTHLLMLLRDPLRQTLFEFILCRQTLIKNDGSWSPFSNRLVWKVFGPLLEISVIPFPLGETREETGRHH